MKSVPLTLVFGILSSASTAGQSCLLERIEPLGVSALDQFGGAVALQAGTLLAAADQTEFSSSSGPGRVFVFEDRPSGWTEVQVLQAGDGVLGDEFGYSLALDGDVAWVGAPQHGAYGAVYVFERSAGVWTQTQELEPDPADYPSGFNGFGVSLALQGDTGLVGSTGYHSSFTVNPSGGAHVFERGMSGWAQTKVAFSTLGKAQGTSVALHGTEILLGAPDTGHTIEGRAFNLSTDPGTTGSTSTTPPFFEQLGRFGTSVARDGERRVIATRGQLSGGGKVYSFAGGGLESALPSFPLQNSFGVMVALDGGTIAAGADQAGVFGGSGDGIAMVWQLIGSDWQFVEAIGSPAEPAAMPSRFGHAVQIAGDTLAVGAPYEQGERGAVYVYSLSGTDPHTLRSDVQAISLSAGGTQNLYLRTCQSLGNSVYFLLGSATGTAPGLLVDGLTLPLNFDSYYLFLLLNPNTLIANSLSLLDPSGEANAHLTLPPGLDPSLAGLGLHHAFVTLDLSGPNITVASVSNPEPLALLP